VLNKTITREQIVESAGEPWEIADPWGIIVELTEALQKF